MGVPAAGCFELGRIPSTVMPAQAGIHPSLPWSSSGGLGQIPAFAGMT
jgi:hypothetical protein